MDLLIEIRCVLPVSGSLSQIFAHYVICTCYVPLAQASSGSGLHCKQDSGAKLQFTGPDLPLPFRTLSSFLPAAAAHLERRITAMEAHLRSSGWNVVAVNTSSTENVAVVGRICHSADSANSTVATLELEGSRACSDGARVKLDCALLSAFSFFPGQIVGIQGRNPTGACLTVHSVVDTFPSGDGTAAASLQEGAALHGRMVIAAGPFVPATGTLDFLALHAVLEHCKAVQPDTLLLSGPFIPDNHPSLKTMRITFEDLFAQQVCPLDAGMWLSR